MERILRFPGGSRRNPEVEEWFSAKAPELAVIARRWFDEMRSCGENVLELLHDGHPTACIGDAAFGYVNTFTSHVNVGFFRGVELADPNGILEGTGKFMRHVKIRPEHGVDDEALAALIRSAFEEMQVRVGSK